MLVLMVVDCGSALVLQCET